MRQSMRAAASYERVMPMKRAIALVVALAALLA